MPKKIPPLSDLTIRACKPALKDITLYDGSGLQLRVLPSGSKNWIFRYMRPYLKTHNNIKLGSYPSMGLAEARERRQQYRQLLAAGTDPQRWLEQLKFSAVKAANSTLNSMFEQWFQVKSSKLSQKYASNFRRSFENHLLPTIGHLPITEITPMQIIEVLRPLEKAGKLETLSRLCQRINELMVWTQNTGQLEHNRLGGIKEAFISPTSTRMKTIKPQELPLLMQRLYSSDLALATRCVFEFQLHTMVRPGEAVTARWQDIDFANSIWNIPAELMKMDRPHQVPLSKQCLAILSVMREFSSGDYIFPSFYRKNLHLNRQTVNNALRKIGYKNKLVAHGLRALASTVLNENSFNRDWIETSLAHGDDDYIRRIYNNAEYLAHRRTMMDWWSDHIETAANGNLSTVHASALLSRAN
ncbi:tyrosine-type recombinase/integrase [Arsukibacterium perlucidum]|uniref:tyrosine-type recombinase/integrase n=1 Tax=Arsukibacterium perlucidum TaxID=368811 RepID=UPI0003A86660|nr:tyrosine-type recombinase/integrase [Arsukibacterium perlucidum]